MLGVFFFLQYPSKQKGVFIVSYQNINITGVGIYHPQNRVNNEFYIEHFNNLGIDIKGLLHYTGRKERYVANDENNTVIAMAVKAAQKALNDAKVDPEEINMIVFASDTPEYTSPCNALKVNYLLNAKNAHIVYDINSNCVGMITAMDQINAYFHSNSGIHKALIIGSQKINSVARKDDPVAYAMFGDGAAAIVLERVIEKKKRGYIDVVYHTDAKHHNMALMPYCGYSKIYNESIDIEDKKWRVDPSFNGNFIIKAWEKMISTLINRNSISAYEIDHFIFSQFCEGHIIETLKNFDIKPDAYTFVGDEYGYTGVASPIFALQRALNLRKIIDGSNVVFCSVGSGYTSTALLWKF